VTCVTFSTGRNKKSVVANARKNQNSQKAKAEGRYKGVAKAPDAIRFQEGKTSGMTKVTTEGEEPLRLERLRGVEAEMGREICGKILWLHDHKGVLYVDWAERPSPQEIMTVIEAWGRHEKEPVTYHYEMGVELVAATARYNPFGSAGDIHRAAIEHLRAARDLLKKTEVRMKKTGSGGSSAIKRHFQSLKLAESALRHARRCQAINLEENTEKQAASGPA
jgi:hypothetical protein